MYRNGTMHAVDGGVVTAKSGHPTLMINRNGKSQILHSRIDPLREKDSFIREIEKSQAELIVILGFGLGYHLARKDLFSGNIKKILCIEYINGILSYPICAEAQRHIDSNDCILLSGLTPEEVARYFADEFSLLTYSSLSVLRHPASCRIFGEYYKTVEEILTTALEKETSNKATIDRFSLSYFKNGLKHIASINTYRSLKMLENVCSGRKVLLVSSSPTLSLFLENIHQNQDGYVIVAVDSAASVLASYGIHCDFIVSVDPQPWVREHLAGGKFPGLRGIITTIVSYPHQCDCPTYMALTSHPLGQLIDSVYPGLFPELPGSGGSVAGDALSVVRIMSPEEIYITGTDFCFAYNVMYSRGTVYQNRYDFYKRDRFYPKERFNYQYILQGGKTYGKWRSRNNFMTYKKGVELLIEDMDKPVISLKEKEGEYGIQNCESTHILPRVKNRSDITGMLKKDVCVPANSVQLLTQLQDERVLRDIMDHAQIDKRYSPKLLTIINNMLISVKKC